MKAEELVQLLRKRFESRNTGFNQCVVLEQVPDGTGMSQKRWIDIAVFQMWESKGLTRSAFEIKVSRHDFLQELAHPEKHQWCQDCFHEFWFVAPKDIIQIDELPTGVGWMYPRGSNSLAIAKNAVRNRKPRLDDSLLAAFMRAAYKEIQSSGKLALETALANSDKYKTAKYYETAVEKFCEQRGTLRYHPSIEGPDAIIKMLESSTADKEMAKDRDQILGMLNRFQDSILDLFSIFAVVAQRSLLEKDKAGRNIISRYGGVDEFTLDTLRRVNGKMPDSERRSIELLEVILNWGKIKA